jgi:hypothetical protein
LLCAVRREDVRMTNDAHRRSRAPQAVDQDSLLTAWDAPLRG